VDHGAPRRFAHAVDIELREDHREGRSAIARRRDPLAHRGDQDSVEVCLCNRALARRRSFRHHGKWAWRGVSQKTDERRQHHRPTLAFGHPLRRAERREADGRGGAGGEIPAFDERLQGAAERARRERQPLGRDRRKQRRRPSQVRSRSDEPSVPLR